jgi:hypothetical protein
MRYIKSPAKGGAWWTGFGGNACGHMAQAVETAPMIRAHLMQLAAATSMVLAASCSGPSGNPETINRDAASRCAKKIDAWKQAVAKLDVLQQELDSISNQIHVDYAKSTKEEKMKIRERLGKILEETDQTDRAADALFSEVMRELEYVSRDKSVRAKLTLVTMALKDAEGIRTPEVQHAMDAVHAELQFLIRPN